jgi:hypothetical protein
VCHVRLAIIMAENHTVAKQRRTVSPDGLLQVFSTAQYQSKLTLHIHSRKSDSYTHDKSQKTVASTLPADGATCSKFTHVCSNKFFDMCNSNFYRHPLWLLSIALSLPKVNVRQHLTTCYLDITSFTYTSTSCQWISAADTFCAHQTHVTPQITKQDLWCITTSNCHSCAPMHLPRIMTTNVTAL